MQIFRLLSCKFGIRAHAFSLYSVTSRAGWEFCTTLIDYRCNSIAFSRQAGKISRTSLDFIRLGITNRGNAQWVWSCRLRSRWSRRLSNTSSCVCSIVSEVVTLAAKVWLPVLRRPYRISMPTQFGLFLSVPWSMFLSLILFQWSKINSKGINVPIA